MDALAHIIKEAGNNLVVTALCWTLFHSLWQGLVFAAMAAILILSTKHTKPVSRYAALSSLLLLLLITSILTFLDEYFHWQMEPQAGLYRHEQLVNAISGSSLAGFIPKYAAWIVTGWLLILLIKATRTIFALGYTGYIRKCKSSVPPAYWKGRLDFLCMRLSIHKPVLMLESALLLVPVVYGHLKPGIFIPLGLLAQLPAEQVEAILLHELAHIRRNDYLVSLLQHTVETLFFFNPALLWLSSLIREEREHCCDDMVIALTGNRKQYVEALIGFKERSLNRQSFYGLAFTGPERGLAGRVGRIVRKQNHTLNLIEKSVLLSSCLVVLLFFFLFRGPQQVRTPAVTDFPIGKVITDIRSDLLKDGLIRDQKSLSFELTNTRLLVNWVRQPRDTWKKLYDKYLRLSPYPINPAYRKNTGFGIFFNAVTHVFGIGTRPPSWDT